MSPPSATSSGTTGASASLAAFLEALDRERVRWSLLRPRGTLGLAQGDVDILVDPADLGRVDGILASLGFIAMPLPGHDVHRLTYDEACGRFVWIHAQPALQIAGAVFTATEVLAAAGGSPPQPQDPWLLWILLLRALVDKGELPERHRPHVAALARRWRDGPPALEALARRHGLDPATIVALAADEEWDALMAHAVPRQPRAPGGWPRRLAGLPAALRRAHAGRGLSVAVLGPDGAGKTTLIAGLAASLPFNTRIQYMGLTGGQLPRADALRVPGLVFAARVAILWLRYARAILHRARGRIVLFDRYTVDGAVPFGRPLTRAGVLSRRVQSRVCPLPDVVILLDASGATMHGRKGEYEPQVLETWRDAYARLRARIDGLQIIDAEQPAEDVRREAEALIWRRYNEMRRVPRRRRRRR